MDVSLTTIPIGAVNWGQSANSNLTKIQEAFSSALSNIRVSAGAASNYLSAITLSNSNGVSFGLNGSVITASVAPGGLTNINLSAGTTSNNLSAVTFSNGNGITFGLSGSVITASHDGLTSQSNQALSASNGSFTFQTAAFSDANNVTFGTSAGGIVTASVAAQSNQTLGLYGSSNTQLTSSGTVDARSLTIRAAGSLTVAVSASEFVLSAPNALTTAMASNRGSDFVQANATFAGTNASGTIASNGISVSVASAGGGGASVSYLAMPVIGQQTTDLGGSLFFMRTLIPAYINATRAAYLLSCTDLPDHTGTHTTRRVTLSVWLGAYSIGTAGSTASLVSSASMTSTWNGVRSTHSSAQRGNSGIRLRTFSFNAFSLTPGDYYFAMNANTSVNDGNGTAYIVGVNFYTGWSGVGESDLTGLYNGVYSITTNGLPNSVHQSAILHQGSMAVPIFAPVWLQGS